MVKRTEALFRGAQGDDRRGGANRIGSIARFDDRREFAFPNKPVEERNPISDLVLRTERQDWIHRENSARLIELITRGRWTSYIGDLKPLGDLQR